ncbi:RNA polymerase sigma factor [Microbispora rosea]|uniref:RNA polymerase sigma factor n=1 Tax=Microbispora rosea TaxID=58117 RepID=UPI00342BBE69
MTDRVAEAREAVAEAHRAQWALVLAATARVARDLDLAEECVQEAYTQALTAWARDGIPDNPAAWLVTTAKRRALDAIRREQVLRAKLPQLLVPDEAGAPDAVGDHTTAPDFIDDPADYIPDDRLRLVFTCCHPALARDAQVALTLRLVCGVGTGDIARAFLVSEATMAARVTRAKKKIAAARIPFRVPRARDLPERLDTVLSVIYLLYTTGHTAPSGDQLLRADLMDRALQLCRMLHALMPDEPEVSGLLALLLVIDARRTTRTDAQGRLLRLAEQDRAQWDQAAIAEGRDLVLRGMRLGRASRYLLQAAIAVLHAEAPRYEDTDWPQIVSVYDRLQQVWLSPVVALNRAVALAMAAGPGTGLREVEALENDPRLAGYHYLPAIKADLLHRLGRHAEAATAYRAALDLTDNAAERKYLAGRLREVTGP